MIDAEFAKYLAEGAKYIAVGLCALSMMAVAQGVSKIWICLIETVGRNPSVKTDVSTFGFIGFAVTEAIALYALVIALIMLFL